jgi:hypothetical protein
MSNPNDPLDPMAFLNEAIANAHAKNEVIAANARIRQLEGRLEAMRDAGDAIWYCVRNAKEVKPEELIEAIDGWQEARNHG